MKNKKALLFGALLAACSFSTVAGVTAMADTVSVGAPTTTNVALSLEDSAFSVTDYSGNTLSSMEGAFNADSPDYDGSIGMLNDGRSSSWSAISPTADGTTRALGWFNVDLGKVQTINKLMLCMQHDWGGEDVVIQLATKADFSDAVTIYNNDADGSMNLGNAFTADETISADGLLSNYGTAGKSTDANGNYFNFTPVNARYVRVTNNQHGDGAAKGYTAVGEIEIYAYDSSQTPAKSGEVVPVAFSKAGGKHKGAYSVELSSVYENAEIYYTTDGSVPTTSSEKYTEAIDVALGETVVIRASAYVNGVLGTPVTAKFVSENANAGTNVALNKPISVKSLDMSEDWTNDLTAPNKPNEAGANTANHINDGGFDFWYAISTEKQAAKGWAIIDFEAEYYVDYVVYEGYWDWSNGENVIELATKADFSDAVRIFDSPTDFLTGINRNEYGATTSGCAYAGTKIHAGVNARYMRVTNNVKSTGYSCFTELQAIAGSAGTTDYVANGSTYYANVAWGKPVSIKSMDMSEDWTNEVTNANAGNALASAQIITDNSFDFFKMITTNGKGTGWAVIDLQSEYYIDYLAYDAYWDWWMGNNKIQVATKADFSDAITVFDYEGGIQTGDFDGDGAVSSHESVQGYMGYKIDVGKTCRYIRVTNDKEGKGENSAFTEIKAFAGVAPTVEEKSYLASYETVAPITLSNGTAWETVTLPETVNATMSDGTVKAVAGTWTKPEGYDGTGGTYTAVFTPADKAALNDVYGIFNVTATITVEKLKPTISVEVAQRIVCDGNAPIVNVTASMEGYTVEYYQGETKLTAPPTVAGEYKVVVSIAATDNSEAATAEAAFTMVDYRALNEKLAEVAALSPDTYVSATWTALSEKVTAAQTVADDTQATQTAIDNALSELTSAQTALVVKADFSNLQTAVNEAKEIVLDNYISAGKTAFSEALTAAEAALANDATTQEDIDAAKTALTNAQAALVLKGDKTELNTLLSGLDYAAENYTEDSYAAYTAAVTAANEVVENDDATQEDIDEAKAALETAIKNLTEKPVTPDEPDEPVNPDEPDEPVNPDEPSNPDDGGDEPTNPDDGGETDDGGESGKGGCSASLLGAVLPMTAMLGAVLIKKRKDE